VLEVGKPYVTQMIAFSENSVEITGESGLVMGSSYTKAGDHRYIRDIPGYVNAAVFSTEGYTVEIYKSGETEFCGYFTFTREDE